MLRRGSKTTDLRAQLTKALQGGRGADALALYELLEKQRPEEPRWSHRKADLLLRMGRSTDAVRAYERAVYLYSIKGFSARAAATAKVMLAIDPSKSDVLERLDPKSRSRGFPNEQTRANRFPPTVR